MPASPALTKRVAALRDKLDSLGNEILFWRDLPQRRAEFKPHTTQLQILCESLAQMQHTITEQLGAAARLEPADILKFERRILAVWQIWECYRSKLAARFCDPTGPVLSLADDLAWLAYRPARDRAAASGAVQAVEVREPPLVFLSPQWSPYARSRERAYELDEATGNIHELAELEVWLRAIPVPLIAIPSYQATHLPEGVFIGHEVGHIIEEDLRLGEPLREALSQALRAAPPERLDAWTQHWRSEIFADVYGVLTAGPAYAGMLLELLSGDPEAIANERRPFTRGRATPQWGQYPTRALRARLVCEAVRRLRITATTADFFSTRADNLLSPWLKTHPGNAMEDFAADIPIVVETILNAPLKAFLTEKLPAGASLQDVLTFGSEMQTSAEEAAEKASHRESVAVKNLRIHYAAVAWAFLKDPQRYRDRGVQQRFQKQMSLQRNQESRAAEASGLRLPSLAERAKAAASAVLGSIE